MKYSTLNAYMWNLLGKLALRSLGIVSTLILVRLLLPSDFGIVAIGFMIVGFFEVLSTCGASRYIILMDNPKESDFNSAWTLDILLKGIAVLSLFALAPFIASMYENDELIIVIWAISLIQYMSAFRNIGLIKDQKNLNFKSTNQVLIVAKLMSFSATLIIAYLYQSYLALIIGTFVNMLVDVSLSYIICKYRPRLNFKFGKDMFVFSRTVLFRNIIGYSRSQLDILLVGKLFGTTGTGEYSIARQFSILPLTEVVSPAINPILSSISKYNGEQAPIFSATYKAFFLSFIVIIPSIAGLYCIADVFTQVILGDKWANVSNYIGVLGALMLPFAIQPLFHILYDSFGKTHLSPLSDIVSILLMLSGFFLFLPSSLSAFVDLRMSVAGITLIFTFIMAKLLLKISLFHLLVTFIIPVLNTSIMVACILAFESYTDFTGLLRLGSTVIVGGFAYVSCLLAMLYAFKLINAYHTIERYIPYFISARLKKIGL